MPDGVLGPGVLAPCARYRWLDNWRWPSREQGRVEGVRCHECEHVFRTGDAVVLAGHPNGVRHWFHTDCWLHGAPWRRAAAERPKAGGPS
jgi:hypothetical protein